MKFPHAGNHEIDDREFVAFWKVWFSGEESNGILEATDSVPRLALAGKADSLHETGRGHGLDALCRVIVPEQYKNTMQATTQFVEQNSHILQPAKAQNPLTGRIVEGVKLTDAALELLAFVIREDELVLGNPQNEPEARATKGVRPLPAPTTDPSPDISPFYSDAESSHVGHQKRSSGATYGKAECKDCFIRLSKPEIVHAREYYSVGGGGRRNYYRKGRDGLMYESGYSASESRLASKKVWVCKDCYAARVKKRKAYALVGVAALIGLIGLFVILALTK